MQLCSVSIHKAFTDCVNITTPRRFCTTYEKCKFLTMGYISALTQASVSKRNKNVHLGFEGIANDTNNISYTVM